MKIIKVLGLITEYNPFHNGHKYHLDESKEETGSDYTIAVMSGNFLQRGEPALLDKWHRAEMAVRQGVDLVIELPVIYACNSAEFFAYGSTYILNSMNIVDNLCFGSESGDASWLIQLANLLANETPEYKDLLSKFLSEGHSFPKSRELALSGLSLDKYNIGAPNNILGLEYTKSLIQMNSPIRPATIKRIQAEYNSTDITSNICSATAIRNSLLNTLNFDSFKGAIPDTTKDILKSSFDDGYGPIFTRDLWQLLLYKIRISSPEYLSTIHDVREGLEHRIKRAANSAVDYNSLLEDIKTKRYTETSIKRVLIKILLDIQKQDIKLDNYRVSPRYIRVLAFNKKGSQILKRLKKESDLPIITNLKNYRPQDDIAKRQIELDVNATNIYNLLTKKESLRTSNDDFKKSPIRFI